MATGLIWDVLSDRNYEVGVDRGVLYPKVDGSGVVWNGLISVDVDKEDATRTPVYFDGVKTNDLVSPGEFSGKIKAITYPVELDDLVGMGQVPDGRGLFLDNQPPKLFDLSYRTNIYDVNHAVLGYKVHLLYNLTAVPDTINYHTISSNIDPIEFSWSITGVPPICDNIKNYRPTCHVILNSLEMDPKTLQDLEDILYGRLEGAAVMVDLCDSIALDSWVPCT